MANADVCPGDDEQPYADLTPPNRILGLVTFVLWFVLIFASMAWWGARRRHPILRKRNFRLMAASSLGMSTSVVAVSYSAYVNRRELDCDVALWCAYLIVCLGAGPMAVRLTNFFLRVQFEQLLLDAADHESTHDLANFAPSSRVSQMGAYLRVVCGCRLACLGGEPRPAADNQSDEKRIAPSVPAGSASVGERSRRKARHRAAFFLQSGFFSALVMVLLLLMAIVPGIIVTVRPDSPFGFKGCKGCTLGNLLFAPVWAQSVVVLCLGSVMLWRVRYTPDPLGIRRELGVVWTLGILLFLTSMLDLLDPGSLHADGIFDYNFIGILIIFCVQIVHCVLPVVYTYHRRSLERFKHTYTIDQALQRPDFKHVFTQYLATEFSMENMLFLDAVQRYKSSFRNVAVSSARETTIRALEVYNSFLGDGSLLEVNVSAAQKRAVREALGPFFRMIDQATIETPPEISLFDACQQEIKRLLEEDSFPRFLRSSMFDEWFRNDQFSAGKHSTSLHESDKLGSTNVESSAHDPFP